MHECTCLAVYVYAFVYVYVYVYVYGDVGPRVAAPRCGMGLTYINDINYNRILTNIM